MNRNSPVFTLVNECQDCYKCIRVCPVKAIKVEAGRATIIGGRCLACGRCVAACPSQAKKIRSDLELVRGLAAGRRKRLLVSLAPSWRAAFEMEAGRLLGLLKKLGFDGTSETALGAQMVSAGVVKILNEGRPGLYISTACPVISDYVRLYRPGFIGSLLPLASPALTHAAWLKKTGGDDPDIVFIGPCGAKKNEADRRPDLLTAVLTFDELRLWLGEVSADEGPAEPGLDFVPRRAHEGALYPIDGGMAETIRLAGAGGRARLLNLSSLELFIEALDQLDSRKIKEPIFIEALACPGGCVSGPGLSYRRSAFLTVTDILGGVLRREKIPPEPEFSLPAAYEPGGLATPLHTLEEIQGALSRLGKYRQEDEINCAGCGYHSCRELAQALLNGDAEPAMCASYMRRQAARKAAAMFKSMPSGMVMLDKNLRIMEVNEAFVRLFGEARPGQEDLRADSLLGDQAEDWLDLPHLFKAALRTGNDIHKERYTYKKRLYDLHIFCIDRGETIGVLITDITSAWGGREKIARQAREVISRNIAIVQEIACLLGEHMVETETILSSIAADFASDDEDERADDGDGEAETCS